MKTTLLTAFPVLLISAFACQRIELSENIRERVPMTISVGFENGDTSLTKSVLINGKEVWWHGGSHNLYAFDSKGYKNIFSAECKSQTKTLDFTGEITSGSTIEYLLYTGVSSSKDSSRRSGSILTGFSLSDQNPSHAASFAANSNVAIMKQGDSGLKNVFGYIKMTLPTGEYSSRIYSVSVSADENLKGNLSINYSDSVPTVSIINDAAASNSVTIKPRWYGKNNIGYQGGDIYLCVPPGIYHNVKLTITPFGANDKEGTLAGGKIGASGSTNTLGGTFSIKPTNDITILRGKYTSTGTLPYEGPEEPEDSVLGKNVLLTELSSANALYLDSENNLLYAGGTGIINVYNVQNPFNAIKIGSVALKGLARQMRMKDGVLYVTARETGTWLFNVSNPAAPSLIKRYDAVELSTGLDVVDNVMFLATRSQGVEFVDISDVSKPEHIRLVGTRESQSVFYSNGYLYSGEWGAGLVTVIDAKDLSDIKTVTTVKLQGYGDGVWVKGDRLFVSTGHSHLNDTPSTIDGDGHGVEIWDISQPETPTFISRVEFDTLYIRGTDYWTPMLSGDGKTLFCADVFNGVYVVDISDEKNPKIIAHHKTDDDVAAVSLGIGNGVLFVAEKGAGIRVIACAKAEIPTIERGVLPANHKARYDYTNSSSIFRAWLPDKYGPVHAAAIYGDALFVACGEAGLSVLKKDSGGNVYKYSQASDNFTADVSIRGNRLYAAEGLDGVAIYTINSDLSLTLEDRITNNLSYKDVYKIALWVFTPNDKFVIVGSRYGGYQIIAIDNSGTVPKYTWKWLKNSYVAYNRYMAYSVCKNDRLPLLSSKELLWFNLSDPDIDKTRLLEVEDDSITGGGVCAFKDSTALITSGKCFKVLKSGTSEVLSTSGSDNRIAGYPAWDGGNNVAVTGFSSSYVRLFDISDFSNPRLLKKESTTGKPETAIFWDGKLVVPCGYQGLLIQNW